MVVVRGGREVGTEIDPGPTQAMVSTRRGAAKRPATSSSTGAPASSNKRRKVGGILFVRVFCLIILSAPRSCLRRQSLWK